MIRNPLIAERLFNTPLLVHPAKLDAIIAGLAHRLGIAHYQAPEPSVFTSQSGKRSENGMYRMVGDIAVLDIFGVLAHRGGLQADSSYILGYQTIARQLDAAANDGAVKGIVLNLDTPGGEVAGAFDLAQMIRDMRGDIPVRAVAGDLAASAGYLIASAAGTPAVTQTGYAGSIGVVMRHVDFSQALANEGIRVTHIFAGDHKIDGNPYAPLPEGVRERFQTEIDELYRLFVETVSANTGLSQDDIIGTQARVYRGVEAVKAGLASGIATPDQVIAELQQFVSKRASANSRRSTSMNTQQTTDAVFTQSDLDQAHADGHAAGLEKGRAEGAESERTRILGILTHAEAEGRMPQAIALVEAGLSVEQAGKVLATSPKAEAGGQNPFAAHMNALGNPGVGPDPKEEATDHDKIQSAWGRVLGHV